MSTKTNFKRIALVAVAALGLGVLSSVPVQAATSNVTFTLTNGTATTAVSDSTTAATVTVNGYVTAAGDTIVVGLVNKTAPALAGSFVARLMVLDTTTSVTKILAGASTTAAGTSLKGSDNDSVTAGTVDGYSILATTQATASYLGAKFGVFIDSSTGAVMPVAGTYVFSILTKVYSAGSLNAIQPAAQDVSIVVEATAAESLTIDPSKSTAFLGAGSGTKTADEAVSVVSTAANTVHATLSVKTFNSSSIERAESITVSIAGAGTLKFGGIGGASLTIAGDGSENIEVLADGRSGIGTISVSTPTKTFAAKTINFYAKAASTITATVATPLLVVGDNAGAVRGVALDANKSAWTGTAYIVASSAADALIAGSTTPVSCGAYDADNARFNCPIAGKTAGTAKFKIIDAATVALATATSNEVSVVVSTATAVSVKIEFDKATYAPNERARIYVTPLDATGKAIQAGQFTNIVSSTGISVNGAISYAGTTTTADSFTANTAGTARDFTTAAQSSAVTGARAGSAMFTVYMPSSGGTVTLNATGGSSLPLSGQVALVATASVTDSGAAALAAVTALATTVASLRTLIVTLTNLVLKIQKKVRA